MIFRCDKLARRANHSDFPKSCQAPESKIFLFFRSQIRRMVCPSHPTEGRIAIVTNVRWDAVDARAATDERGLSVRRNRVVLTPRCWRQVAQGPCRAQRRWQESRSPGRARYKP